MRGNKMTIGVLAAVVVLLLVVNGLLVLRTQGQNVGTTAFESFKPLDDIELGATAAGLTPYVSYFALGGETSDGGVGDLHVKEGGKALDLFSADRSKVLDGLRSEIRGRLVAEGLAVSVETTSGDLSNNELRGFGLGYSGENRQGWISAVLEQIGKSSTDARMDRVAINVWWVETDR